MCFSTAKWKREVVQDHKFDFIDVDEFYDKSPIRKLQYAFVFVLVIKAILMYTADLWTAYLLLTIGDTGSSAISQSIIPIRISKWIFIGSIGASITLLLWEWNKARRIIRSRDIAYAYTNIAAYRFYCIRSYSHFCLFSAIGNSRQGWDRVAFFVYFTLKGWKRLLFADGPRQVINASTLFRIFYVNGTFRYQNLYEYDRNDITKQMTFSTMAFSFALFSVSALFMAFAAFLYIPLLCNIRGNLKEYVCHKIDKRIATLLVRKSRNRIKKEQREQARLKDEMSRAQGGAMGAVSNGVGPQPTLPKLDAFDEGARPVSAMIRPAPGFSDKRAAPGMGGSPYLQRRPSIESVSTSYSNTSRRQLVRNGPSTSDYPHPPMPPAPFDPHNRPPIHGSYSYGTSAAGSDYGDVPPYRGTDNQSEVGGYREGPHYDPYNQNGPPPPAPPAPRFGGGYADSDAGSNHGGSNYGGPNQYRQQAPSHTYPSQPQPYHQHNAPNAPYNDNRGSLFSDLPPPRRPESPSGSVSSGRFGGRNRLEDSEDDMVTDRYAAPGRSRRQYNHTYADGSGSIPPTNGAERRW